MRSQVFLEPCVGYQEEVVRAAISEWSSAFRSVVRRGDRVVIKPNWIAESHKFRPSEWDSVITHPAVITVVLEQVLACLGGEGSVLITDGPQTDSSWRDIMARMTPELWLAMGKAAGIPVEILDLRDDEWIMGSGGRDGAVVERRGLPGDPLGSTVCDLSESSEFVGHRKTRWGYYGADYDTDDTNQAHSARAHRYRVSRSVMSSDVFINLPKMKTHKKAGITCCLKNLVGINTYKNWLPHYTLGTPSQGGDQYATSRVKQRLETAVLRRIKATIVRSPVLARVFGNAKRAGKHVFGDTKSVVRSGNWHGNDTLWRMVLDLNKVLAYADADGRLRSVGSEARKRYLAVVDGIVAGEGDGPEAPERREANLLLCGTDPVAVDAVCATLMGFDWRKIPSIANAFRIERLPLTDTTPEGIEVQIASKSWVGGLADLHTLDPPFAPHFGWRGHIEANLAASESPR